MMTIMMNAFLQISFPLQFLFANVPNGKTARLDGLD